ncbi:MAG: cytochrome P450 [Blastochloris sp.]|nr:cytochrome P450 [Blastochloris sp.]
MKIFPEKWQVYAGLFRNLLKARKNLIEVWPPEFYSDEFIKIELPWGAPIFIINHPDDVRSVMVDRAAGYIKSRSNVQTLKPLLGDGLFVSEGALWRRQRKIAAPSTHGNRMAAYAQIILDEAELWEQNLLAQPVAETDLSKSLTMLTAEIISRIMFGYRLGQGNEILYRAFAEYQASHGRVHLSELLRIPDWLPRPSMWKGRRAVRRVDQVMLQILSCHKSVERASEEDNLLDMLLEYRDEEGKGMAPDLIRDEMVSIFLAGHETTALTLGWIFHLLEKHPEVESRLHEELDVVLGDRKPEFGDYPRLPYTKAVVEETLRLYPPVHVFSREAVEEDCLRGNAIPKGSFVIISSWLLHRHQKYWKNPEEFKPERFLPENVDGQLPYAYIPFGAGPRICLGKHLGLMESVLILATLARRFEFRQVEAGELKPVGRMTLRPEQNIRVRVKVRNINK